MSGCELREAASLGDVKAVACLLRGGANPCSVDEHGMTALHYAAWNGNVECLEYLAVNDVGWLRKEGTRVRVSCLDLQTNAGWTALHLAALGAEAAAGRTLLLAGADASLRDAKGQTPLDLGLKVPTLQEQRAAMRKWKAERRVLERQRPPNESVPETDGGSSTRERLVGREAAYEYARQKPRKRCPDTILPEDCIKAFARQGGKVRDLAFALDEASRCLAHRRHLVALQYDAKPDALDRQACFQRDQQDAEALLKAANIDFFFNVDDMHRRPITDRVVEEEQ